MIMCFLSSSLALVQPAISQAEYEGYLAEPGSRV